MRPRDGTYSNLEDGEKETAWYWRVGGIGSSFMILGGFLMLQSTFDSTPQLRLSSTALAIFAVALLAVGVSFTGLLCFVVRSAKFQASTIFLPAWSASALALLTIFYDFLTSSRYTWNVPALLYTIAAALGTIIYGGMLIYTQRKVTKTPSARSQSSLRPLRPSSFGSMRTADTHQAWQDPGYYENYVRNMYPTSLPSPAPASNYPQQHQPPFPTDPNAYDPNSIPPEELQRQQMLMLLLHKEQPPTPDPSASTFHIDWQGGENEDSPVNGYYAPSDRGGNHPYSTHPGAPSMYSNGSNLRGLRGWSARHLPPWDRVWRGVAGRSSGDSGEASTGDMSQWQRVPSPQHREERRREIEMGR